MASPRDFPEGTGDLFGDNDEKKPKQFPVDAFGRGERRVGGTGILFEVGFNRASVEENDDDVYYRRIGEKAGKPLVQKQNKNMIRPSLHACNDAEYHVQRAMRRPRTAGGDGWQQPGRA